MADEPGTTNVVRDIRDELIGRIKSKLREYGRTIADLQTKLKDKEKELGDHVKKYDEDEVRKELEALKSQVRTDKHKAKFTEVAKASGARDDALADLWDRSGYKADTDTVDDARIKTAIDAQKVERSYMFRPAEETPPAEAPLPGPARGQGGNGRTTGKFVVTPEQLRDPAWVFANNAAMQKAREDGTIHYT